MPRKQQRFRITLADDLLKEKLTLHLIQDDFAKGRYRIRYKGRLSTRYHDTTGTVIAQRVSKWMQRQQNKAHTPLDICISNIIVRAGQSV